MPGTCSPTPPHWPSPWPRRIGTRPLDLDAWLLMIPLALGFGVLEESRKWLVRRNRSGK